MRSPPSSRADHLAERAFGERAGRDDHRMIRQLLDAPPLDPDARMEREPLRDRAREPEPLDRERLPGRHAVLIGARDHQRAGAP